MGKRQKAAEYAHAVVDALVDEFPSLTQCNATDLLRDAVAHHALKPDGGFEFIVDDPLAANWRLRAYRDVPQHVRIVCFRARMSRGDHAKEQRINRALGQLPT